MDTFEHAMKMEMDGKAFYEENAAKMGSPALKKILLELAADEQKHYLIFKAMRDGKQAEYKEAEQTHILTSVKNVFEQLKAENKDFTFPADAREIWVQAREIEKEAEKFYRERADQLSDDNQKNIFNRIADEEHRHWVTMENVIQFLDQPKTWLENAEWADLDEH